MINFGYVFALLCVLCWSFIPIVARMGQVNLSNIQFLFYSNLLSVFVVLISSLIYKIKLFQVSLFNLLHLAILGFLGCFFYYILLYYGYANENPATVLIIQYTWPAITVLLSVIILKERLSLQSIFGVILGTCGVFYIFTGGNIGNFSIKSSRVLLIVLLAAFSFGLFSVLSKKLKVNAFISAFWFFIFGTIFSFIYMIANDGIALPSSSSLAPVLINGMIINGISYLFWIQALKLADASKIAPLILITPALAITWLFLFNFSSFSMVYVIGLGLTILSGLLCTTKIKFGFFKK